MNTHSSKLPDPNDPDQEPQAPDVLTERSLEVGLHREPLSEEALARIRTVVEAEWRATVPSSQVRGWRRRGIALVASIAVISVLAALWFQPVSGASVFGTVMRADTGALASRSMLFTSRALSSGDVLRTAERVTARSPALVALTSGGTLRIARGSVVEARSVHEVELLEGDIYVDLPPGQHPSAAFVVRTALGSIEHLGTQFEVATVDQSVRVRVREGQVRLRRAAGTEVAIAGTEMMVPPSGPVIRQSLSTSGRYWSWVEALAPDYEIEDRPLMDFLQWAARETGRPLDFGDRHAREVAERTRLHGTVRGLMPLEAVGRVISTTTLKFDLEEDAIRVSSGG